MTQYISAHERLRTLPELFRGCDLTVRHGFDSKTASQYLYLWKGRELVVPLGGHSDVYANLVLNRHPQWERAVLMAMPSAVLVGIEVLRRAGWTTQIPARPQVAVNARQRHYRVNPYEIDFRGARWFKQTAQGIVHHGHGVLPSLHPAWALADLLRGQEWGGMGLHPDDIEWDEVDEAAEKQWGMACKAYGMDAEPISEFIVYSRCSR